MKNRDWVLRWSHAKHIIVDSAVERYFFQQKLKDYPKGYLENYGYSARLSSRRYKNVWVTLPDYPSDYYPESVDSTENLRKTFANIDRFTSEFPDVNWLYPLQSGYRNRIMFCEAAERLLSYDPERIGIGTVCKTKDTQFIAWALAYTRSRFPKAYIHAFGLTLTALPKVLEVIDSFDSVGTWLYQAFPHRPGHNTKESAELFLKYVERIQELTGGVVS